MMITSYTVLWSHLLVVYHTQIRYHPRSLEELSQAPYTGGFLMLLYKCWGIRGSLAPNLPTSLTNARIYGCLCSAEKLRPVSLIEADTWPLVETYYCTHKTDGWKWWGYRCKRFPRGKFGHSRWNLCWCPTPSTLYSILRQSCFLNWTKTLITAHVC